MIQRRPLLRGLIAAGGVALAGRRARAANAPGVSATEIKIGNTEAYSGPASAYGMIGKSQTAYFNMINEKGGVNGRRITFLSYDDGYSPPRTVEQTRRLVEQDEVACIFNSLGTPTNSAIERYLNAKKIPHLFLATGADKWGDYQKFPWTIGFQPSYRTEAQIYAKHILRDKPGAKVAVLFQNDDFGKDYVNGLKDIFGDKYDTLVVKSASYEVSDPTIDSQMVTLQGSGADVLVTAATPKFAAQVIRKAAELGWKPQQYLTNVSISVGAVIKPAGEQNALGIITGAYLKDSTDPRWADDAGVKEWRAFMDKYMPGTDQSDGNTVYGYASGATMVQVLHQCGDDLSRENIMKQALSLHDFVPGVLLPGVKISTGPTNYHPMRQMQLARWSGTHWDNFGEVIEGSGA
jgi:branched-chain amino acid transport system substrate-binding protein